MRSLKTQLTFPYVFTFCFRHAIMMTRMLRSPWTMLLLWMSSSARHVLLYILQSCLCKYFWCALHECVSLWFVHFRWPLFLCFRLKTSGTALTRLMRMWPKWRNFSQLFFLHQHQTRVRHIHMFTHYDPVQHCFPLTGIRRVTGDICCVPIRILSVLKSIQK